MSLNSEVLSNNSRSKNNNSVSARNNNVASSVNVGGIERLVCAIGGGALAAYGLRRRSAGGLILTLTGAALVHVGATGHCDTYRALRITTADDNELDDGVARDVHVEKSIIIDKSPEELFRFWRQFENLPRFMDHLESVNSVGINRWHWVAKGPIGTRPEWDAEIYNEKPNELIAWRSVAGNLTNAGSVHFDPAPGERGTQVRVVLNYNTPGGKVSALLAKVLGHEPGQMIQEDLRRLKELFARGEITPVEDKLSARVSANSTNDNSSSTEHAQNEHAPTEHRPASMTPAGDLVDSRAASSGG